MRRFWPGWPAAPFWGRFCCPGCRAGAFSQKGLWLGLFLAGLLQLIYGGHGLDAWGRGLALVALCSFGLMNFTGSSTYTGLSGVKKEMRLAVPLQIMGAACALALFALARLGQGGGV